MARKYSDSDLDAILSKSDSTDGRWDKFGNDIGVGRFRLNGTQRALLDHMGNEGGIVPMSAASGNYIPPEEWEAIVG